MMPDLRAVRGKDQLLLRTVDAAGAVKVVNVEVKGTRGNNLILVDSDLVFSRETGLLNGKNESPLPDSHTCLMLKDEAGVALLTRSNAGVLPPVCSSEEVALRFAVAWLKKQPYEEVVKCVNLTVLLDHYKKGNNG